MTTKVKTAFLIDAKNETIVPYEVTGLKSLQKAVGGYIERAATIGRTDIFVDEEGLLKTDKPGIHKGFSIKGHNAAWLAGSGVVIDHDDEGDSVDCLMSIDELKKIIEFKSLIQM